MADKGIGAGKPTYLEAHWSVGTSLEIKEVEEELNIQWADVEGYWIKWNALHLNMKDGAHHEFPVDTGEVDWKRPYSTILLDEDYNEIEEEN
tara:strand:+ start:657 stop:932 length:276 start_codon:yes stop_codon:yes gene_type:complete